MVCLRWRSHSNVAIFCGQFGIGLMQVVFSFYYVKVFLNIFHVGEYWFNIAQLLFMFWNAVNDPLFGYIQDIGESWMTNRLKIFTYIGPLMSVSFLILWFPWSSRDSPPYVEGIHLIVSLFLYDAFYSCVGVAWSALFTESTRTHSRRVSGLKYAQVASLISSNIIAIIERFSHSLDNFHVFQGLCFSMAMISTLCFFVTARFGSADGVLTRNRRTRRVSLKSDEIRHSADAEDLLADDKSEDENSTLSDDSRGNELSTQDQVDDNPGSLAPRSDRTSWNEILKVSREIVSAPDFWRVVMTNFIHTCRGTVHLNFASMVVDLLIPQSILPKGSWQLGAFFALCTALPQILFVCNERLLLKLGAYGIFMRGFYASIFASILLYFFAWNNPMIIMLFLVVDTIAVHSTSPLFNILFAEFVEDDALRNRRRRTMSSLVFSLNALIVKPAMSITPVIVVYLLNRSGYELYRQKAVRDEALVDCALRLIFGTPLLLSLLELLALGGYSLRAQNCAPKIGVASARRPSLAVQNL